MDNASPHHLPAGELTGRIDAGPDLLLNQEVLEPQFRFEAEHLLPHYVGIEQVQVLEYHRMGLLPADETSALVSALRGVTADKLLAYAGTAMSDISFALERYVLEQVGPMPSWHVDRSRNDAQACAQLMLGRKLALHAAERLSECAHVVQQRAAEHVADVMPGYTHLQPAQVITPGFYLSALSGRLLNALDRLAGVYDRMNACPLGSGAMSGLELGWDRDRMATLLGFARPEPHALTGVASREWLLELAAECSNTGVVLSRFVTDVMAWTSGAYGLCELPDRLSGISSAMPQKKNYPILERIRGKTAHLTAWYVDVAGTQRSVSYSNTVEVSKEGSAQLYSSLSTFGLALRLFTTVLEHLTFHTDRLRTACEREYLGGFSLANRLTLDSGIPWRMAQVIAGRYITAALQNALPSSDPDGTLLASVAAEHGYEISEPDRLLAGAFSPQHELRTRRTPGSAHPDAVTELLREQSVRLKQLDQAWQDRRNTVAKAEVDLAAQVAPTDPS